MIRVLGTPRRFCDGLTRRETLCAGALSFMGGLGLPTLLRAAEAGKKRRGRAKHVILLFLAGGPATQDMWDLKPGAPDKIRGEFRPIATSAPGIQICEHLPRSAKWMHQSVLVRSVNHKAGCHNCLPAYTGYEVLLPDGGELAKDTYPPSMGSICEYLKMGSGQGLPAYAYLPFYMGWGEGRRKAGPYAGFLGKSYDPFFTVARPHVANPPEKRYSPQVCYGEPRVPNGELESGMTLDHFNHRRTLAAQLDRQMQRLDGQHALDGYGRIQERAYSVLTSPKVRAAFNLDAEEPKRRDRFGRNLFGSSTLLARRLIEAGVRFVNVTWDVFERADVNNVAWDTHQKNFSNLREHNLPLFDQTFSALMEDLSERGLLEETLVVVMGEMGRTPQINGDGGRDHWTYCYSVLLAGAGLRGGMTYGASDANAALVKDRPVSTADICATVYECLGIDPNMEIHDRGDRPIPVAHGGRPIHDILR